jgi:hypothetical protein
VVWASRPVPWEDLGKQAQGGAGHDLNPQLLVAVAGFAAQLQHHAAVVAAKMAKGKVLHGPAERVVGFERGHRPPARAGGGTSLNDAW